MPKVKDKKRRSGGSDDSDGEHVAGTQAVNSQSQPTLTQAEKSANQLPADERDKLVNNIVRYMLIADQKKLPIKRADIVKYALKEHGRAFVPLMQRASDILLEVFGIKAVYEEKMKGYILVNTIDNIYSTPHLVWSPQDQANIGLVTTILVVIFMNGNVADDEKVFDMLRRLGVNVDDRDDVFGDVKQLVMTTFVRQGYLETERVQGVDPPKFNFRWGPRARLETSKRSMLDFVNQLYGITTEGQERWIAQLRDVELTEPMEGTSRD